MQKALGAAMLAAIIGIGCAANAGDLNAGGGLKDDPVYAPETIWTGFYLGLGGGAVNNANSSFHDIALAEPNGLGGDGGFGTVEVGYNRQFGRLVAGAFDVNTSLRIGGVNASDDLDGLWSASGRVGYLVNRSTLAYELGAYSEAHFTFSPSNPIVHDQTYSGFSAGGGIEDAFGRERVR